MNREILHICAIGHYVVLKNRDAISAMCSDQSNNPKDNSAL